MKNVINESKINKSIDDLKKRQHDIRMEYTDPFQAASDLENLHVAIVGLSFCKKYLKENNMKEIKV